MDSNTSEDSNAEGDFMLSKTPIGVRYSLKDMLQEVKFERQQSALGRELIDSTEIKKMFSDKRYRKRRRQ